MARRSGLVLANGTELYYECRGSGPPVLFVPGATGDAGHFERVAELLADEFLVVTYDRRGNSRSPRLAGWMKTSMDEQADDAAGLLRGLGRAPAVVFGTSGGAVILLDLLLRHPDVLRGAIVHEPPIVRVLPNAAELGAQLQRMTEEAVAAGGPRGAMEAFVRANTGDVTFEQLDPQLRQRMLGNGELFFTVELSAFVSYVPDAAALARASIPVQVLAGAESRGLYTYEAARWIAEHCGLSFQEIPGAHAPYLARPEEFVAALRPFLR